MYFVKDPLKWGLKGVKKKKNPRDSAFKVNVKKQIIRSSKYNDPTSEGSSPVARVLPLSSTNYHWENA